MAKSVEKELLTATGEDPRGEEEGKRKYFGRLVKAANALAEKDWNNLSEGAQNWVNGNVEAINDEKDLVQFPAPPAEDDDKPAKKKDDEGDGKMKPRATTSKKDDDEKPAAKKPRDDDDDEKPAKKAAKDDDDDKPAKKSDKAADDDEKPAKREGKPGAIPHLKEMVIAHPTWSKAKVVEKLEEEGYGISPNTVGIAYYDVKNTLKACKRAGVLKADFAEQIDTETDNRPEQFKKASEKKAAAKDDDEKPAKKKPRDDDDD